MAQAQPWSASEDCSWDLAHASTGLDCKDASCECSSSRVSVLCSRVISMIQMRIALSASELCGTKSECMGLCLSRMLSSSFALCLQPVFDRMTSWRQQRESNQLGPIFIGKSGRRKSQTVSAAMARRPVSLLSTLHVTRIQSIPLPRHRRTIFTPEEYVKSNVVYLGLSVFETKLIWNILNVCNCLKGKFWLAVSSPTYAPPQKN